MTEVLPCLLRIGDNVKKYKVFKFDREQITIGRSGEVTYAILSNMISRCHCMIKQHDKSWTITDNKSLNGVFVNGRPLTPMTPYTLNDGDMVQFGVPTAPNVPAEFIYKFYASLKVRVEKKAKRLKPDEHTDSEKATLSFSESSECGDDDRERKRKVAHFQGDDSSPSKRMKEQMLREQAAKEKVLQEQAAKEAEYQSRLAEMEKLLATKEQEQLEVQKQLELERQEKAKQAEEMKQKETAILTEMEDKQRQLEEEKEQLKLKMQTELETNLKEKEELRLKMQAELESNLKEREAALMAQLKAQKESLIEEKRQVEENLQKEMAKAEKNKEAEQNLVEQQEKLQKVLEKKEMEQKMLEAQLNETKEKSETHALKAKEEILSNFVNLMEMELQCSICNELFIKATSLNCSHTFCKLCINQWMKVKKECPNCRKPVISQLQAIALDSYIDKMVENLNDELKQRRTELVAQRTAEQTKFDGLVAGPSRVPTVATPVPATAPPPQPPRPPQPPQQRVATAPAPIVPTRQSTRTTRGRGRRRGGAAAAATTTRQTTPATPIVIGTPVAATTARQTTPAAPIVIGAPPATPAPAHATTSQATTATTSATSTVATNPPAHVVISDEESDPDFATPSLSDAVDEEEFETPNTTVSSDEEDDEGVEDSDSVEGDEEVYYGGYGRCFNCGRRGHWANGCPF